MSFQDDLQSARAALASGQNFVYEGKTYTPARIVKELIGEKGVLTLRAEQELQAMQAQARTVTQERNTQRSQEKATASALERAKKKLKSLENNKNIFLQSFVNREITEVEYNARFALVDQLKSDIGAMEAGAPAISIGGTSDPFAYKLLAPQEALTLTARRTDIAGRTGFATPGPPTPRNVPATVGGAIQGSPSPFLDADGKPIETGTGAVGSAASVAKTKTVTKAEVDVALASSGLADTPANRKQIREGLKAGTKTEANWETLVAEQAGEYAYLLDPQYEGVPELLRKAVKEGYFKSDEGLKQFVQELKQTGYYRNTSQRQQSFDKKTPADKRVAIELEVDKIRAEYGEIQFDQAGLEEVAGVAARNGASPVELGRLVYRAAFKRGSVAPDFTAPVAAKTALGGQDADRIRSIYRAYGQRADDQMISRILAGDSDPASGVVMTEDMLRTNLRDIAKVSYSPFSDLLDRGVSIETIFSPYQNIAASVLEKPRDQISLLTNDGVPTEFASALSGDKPKSLNDWISELKRNPKYNYQFTSAANAEVSSMVSTLEKAFGFRQ